MVRFQWKAWKQFIWVAASLVLAFLCWSLKGNFSFAPRSFTTPSTSCSSRGVGRGKTHWRGQILISFGGIGINLRNLRRGTLLMLAWMLSRNQDRFNQWGSLFKAVAIVSLPAALVLLQPDAGTVLVFTGLILVFYRKGYRAMF